MKKVVVSVCIVIVVIFSRATSFLEAAKKGSSFDFSDLEQALPLDNFILSKELKAAAHAYEVAVVKGKDPKEIVQLKERFLTILPKKEENVFSIFLYAITHSFDSVVTLLTKHQIISQLLCKNKNFTPELKDAVEQGDVEFLFSQFDDAPVAWHSVPGCKVTEKIKKISVPTCLEDVSDDCLGNILSYIDGNEVLCKKIVVCERWRQLIVKRPKLISLLNVYGRSIVLQGKNDVKVVTTATLAPYVPHLRALCCSGAEQAFSFAQAGFKFKKIKILSFLKGVKEVNIFQDFKDIKNFKDIIDISDLKDIADHADCQEFIKFKIFAQVFPCIDGINLNAYSLSGMIFSFLFKIFKNLKYINLNDCTRVSDALIATIIENSCELEIIGFRNCTLISDRGLRLLLQKCENIKEIELRGCLGVSEPYRKYLDTKEKVEQLRKVLLQSSS